MPTKAQTDFAFHQLGQVLRDLETDLRWKLDGSVRIPAEWHDIAQSREQPLKTKITLRVDQDVARFFRAMGQGHLTRMNAVLRAFMLARLAEVVKAEARYEMTPKEVEHRVRDEIFAVIRRRGPAGGEGGGDGAAEGDQGDLGGEGGVRGGLCPIKDAGP